MLRGALGIFPSRDHREYLGQKLLDHGYSLLTEDEQRYLHNYRCGMRRVLLGKFDKRYDGDPNGKFYDEKLADATEDFYKRQFGNRGMVA